MSHNTDCTRRQAIAVGATGVVGALAGCSSVVGESTEEPANQADPSPEIIEISSEIGNFRKTDERARTLILVKNNGRLGEFRLIIEAIGEHVVLEDAEQLFSLEEGQEFQTRFDLFTHTGARDVRVFIEATEHPENFDEVVLNEQDTPEKIDFTG